MSAIAVNIQIISIDMYMFTTWIITIYLSVDGFISLSRDFYFNVKTRTIVFLSNYPVQIDAVQRNTEVVKEIHINIIRSL